MEEGIVSDEKLRKALAFQALQCGKTLPLGVLLDEMAAIEESDADTELERQARERVRLYGKESPVE